MRRLTLTLLISMLFLISAGSLFAQDKAEKKSIGLDFGIDYWSDYYYRGQSFYGSNTGVFFPWIGYGGLKDFYFYLGGEVAAETLGDPEQRGSGNDWYGIDIIISYDTTVADGLLNIGGHVAYYTYPVGYPGVKDGVTFQDFFNLRFSLGFNVILNPTIKYQHNFWLDYGIPEDEDKVKDGYLTLSIGHDFTLTKEATIGLGLAGSFWYYGLWGQDKFGFSDLLASVKLTVAAPSGISFTGSLNFGWSPDVSFTNVAGSNDFQWPAGDQFKWYATFGVTYSI